MKDGREFQRFVICLVAAFIINFIFTSELIGKMYTAGYIYLKWDPRIVGYVVSFIILYVLSLVFFRMSPKKK